MLNMAWCVDEGGEGGGAGLKDPDIPPHEKSIIERLEIRYTFVELTVYTSKFDTNLWMKKRETRCITGLQQFSYFPPIN